MRYRRYAIDVTLTLLSVLIGPSGIEPKQWTLNCGTARKDHAAQPHLIFNKLQTKQAIGRPRDNTLFVGESFPEVLFQSDRWPTPLARAMGNYIAYHQGPSLIRGKFGLTLSRASWIGNGRLWPGTPAGRYVSRGKSRWARPVLATMTSLWKLLHRKCGNGMVT